jgi:hypothetical protein
MNEIPEFLGRRGIPRIDHGGDNERTPDIDDCDSKRFLGREPGGLGFVLPSLGRCGGQDAPIGECQLLQEDFLGHTTAAYRNTSLEIWSSECQRFGSGQDRSTGKPSVVSNAYRRCIQEFESLVPGTPGPVFYSSDFAIPINGF